ncbi:type II toxin-antitoxin system VapC family toxin [Candidatus Albibeggiatoa sp. nov. BB20]|uniref:type II toxin-antitoxin system tRNA(fMet)-specific endonuclease VapC n=1 Tax=Candidatus Albibeggiatoa sp. nov. BB20 TaxID=3162723 RepID=UPI003365ABAD
MKYLLDTNVCIVFLNERSERLKRRLLMQHSHELAVCSVVKAELFYGAMKSINPTKAIQKQHYFLNHFISLPFDDNAAQHYGEIRAALAKQGQPIGPNDFMIAAIALSHNLTLVTHNTREFSRIPHLTIEDWEA